MTFERVVSFPDQSPSFALGFEAGRIYAALSAGERVEGQLVHAENAEVLLRIADALDVCARAEFTNDPGWMMLHAG